MFMKNYKSSYAALSSSFYSLSSPAITSFSKSLFAYNENLANELGLPEYSEHEKLQVFSGEKSFEGEEPFAMIYAGHQFGHFNPKLGDGRAVIIGEANGFDIQLKGSGKTPYSRRGDGKSPIGPVVREYLLSEYMHNVKIPTTRSLAAVRTEEVIVRNSISYGGIFTRVAKSHLRVGSFQYFAAKGEIDRVTELADYTIKRLFPSIKDVKNPYLALFQKVASHQVQLIPRWMSVGFIHGVMNTDNTSVSGETIDYGPCAFMDEFDYYKVFSSIDKDSRYAFGNQPQIIMWNLARFADTLIPLISNTQDDAVSLLEAELKYYNELLVSNQRRELAKKLALVDESYSDKDDELVELFLLYLQEEELDFTNSFRALSSLLVGDSSAFKESDRFHKFKDSWLNRLKDKDFELVKRELDMVNPYIIPRNHLIEEAIVKANEGDFKLFNELNTAFSKPFEANKEYLKFTLPPKDSEKVRMTFCGT